MGHIKLLALVICFIDVNSCRCDHFKQPSSFQANDEVMRWLETKTKISHAIFWEDKSSTAIPFNEWSTGKKDDLIKTIHSLLKGKTLSLPQEPPLKIRPKPYQNAVTTLSEKWAWEYYISYISHSLAIEYQKTLPWSLEDLSHENLLLILDSRSMFVYDRSLDSYKISVEHLGHVTPDDPVKSYNFLNSLKPSPKARLQTIKNLLNWSRTNLLHDIGMGDSKGVFAKWQYYGSPPVSKMIEGTINTEYPELGKAHQARACWGAVGFLRAVLRTQNIPAKLVKRCGHALIYFPTENLYLSHGDDIYNSFAKAEPPIDISELFIDSKTFKEWFGEGFESTTHCENVGRRMSEIAIKYLPPALLKMKCEDDLSQKTGKTIQEGKIFSYFNLYMDAHILFNDKSFLTRLSTEINKKGGCYNLLNVPPSINGSSL